MHTSCFHKVTSMLIDIWQKFHFLTHRGRAAFKMFYWNTQMFAVSWSIWRIQNNTLSQAVLKRIRSGCVVGSGEGAQAIRPISALWQPFSVVEKTWCCVLNTLLNSCDSEFNVCPSRNSSALSGWTAACDQIALANTRFQSCAAKHWGRCEAACMCLSHSLAHSSSWLPREGACPLSTLPITDPVWVAPYCSLAPCTYCLWQGVLSSTGLAQPSGLLVSINDCLLTLDAVAPSLMPQSAVPEVREKEISIAFMCLLGLCQFCDCRVSEVYKALSTYLSCF